MTLANRLTKENNQIGRALFISPKTVQNHMSSILAKLQVQNRIQAAVHAARDGILRGTSPRSRPLR